MKKKTLLMLSSIIFIVNQYFNYVNASPIQINATSLSPAQITLSNVGAFPTVTVQSFNLDPGEYSLNYQSDLGYVFGHVSFTVTNAGTIDYDPELEGVLHGSGTNDLLVSGATINYNVTALSSTNVGVLFYEPERPTAQPFSLTLLPGQHGIWYLAGLSYVFGHVSFTVTNAGTIDYDPELEGVLHGSGTNDLLVSGS